MSTPPPLPGQEPPPRRIVRTERRKRGFFGTLFKLLLIGFNVLMLVWLVSYWADIGGEMNKPMTDAEKAGTAVGTTIGSFFIITVWVAGAIVLGLLSFFTRGDTVVIEERTE